jgi:hypothetical protein
MEVHMKRIVIAGLAGLIAAGTAALDAAPALAQSVGYVTGFPGRDPADDDGFGWGRRIAPKPRSSSPGRRRRRANTQAADYYRRTGRTVYPPVGTFRSRGRAALRDGGLRAAPPDDAPSLVPRIAPSCASARRSVASSRADIGPAHA